MNDFTVIDSDALGRLEDWGGQDLVRKMLGIFLEHAPERMEQIRVGAGNGALEDVERGAHSLKSSAGNLGVRRLQSRAAEMEARAAHGDADGVRSLLPELESAFAEGSAAVAELEESLSG